MNNRKNLREALTIVANFKKWHVVVAKSVASMFVAAMSIATHVE